VRVLLVSGIWPPDVGGPASHAPEVAAFLRARGHEVEVVVTADRAPAPEPYPVHWTSRRLPKGARHLHAAALVARLARRADAVYTTGMFARSAVGARLARRPYVVKLTGDPAFERLRARGSVGGTVEEFQETGGFQARALGRLRGSVLRGAAHVYCPSEYLRLLVLEWGVDPARTAVLPNPAPAPPAFDDRDELRRRLGLDGVALAFAGRLTAQKALPLLLEAVSRADGVTLAIAGEGPERGAVEAGVRRLGLEDRVRLLGPLSRDGVLELFHAADGTVLSSGWENFPHSVVESLAVGTPVLATDVGGVAEVVRDGENGLLVAPGDAAALAAAIGRFAGDEDLRRRLRAAAAPSVEPYGVQAVFAELEATLQRVAR
jgi:glycosyltransferase involved in cell wall biosynthesis